MKKRYYAATGYGDDKENPNFLLMEISEHGKMQTCQKFYCEGGPSYLATKQVHGEQECFHIYAALEKKNQIVLYEWKQGTVSERGRFEVPGEGVCHLCLTEDEMLLYASCYMSGDFFAVDTELKRCMWAKPGTDGSHAHCVSQKMREPLYTVDLGLSKIEGYCLNEQLLREKTFDFQIEKEEGPRQILTWDSGQYAAVINECASTISFWRIENQCEKQKAQRICTCNATSYAGSNAPGDAVIWKEKILFVGNRGADTIAAFSLEDLGNKIGEWDCGGRFPRGLFISENGILLAACQHSGTIMSYIWNENEEVLQICDSIMLPGAASITELLEE